MLPATTCNSYTIKTVQCEYEIEKHCLHHTHLHGAQRRLQTEHKNNKSINHSDMWALTSMLKKVNKHAAHMLKILVPGTKRLQSKVQTEMKCNLWRNPCPDKINVQYRCPERVARTVSSSSTHTPASDPGASR